MVQHWRTGWMLVCVAIMLIAHSASYMSKTSTQWSDITPQHGQMHTVSIASSAAIVVTKNLAPQKFVYADVIAQPNGQSTASAVDSCGAFGGNCTSPANSNSASEPTPRPSSDYLSHFGELNFAAINSPRFLNLAQHDVREVKPEYLLALDFTTVSTLNVIESPKLNIISDWTLSAVSSPARISGWKVSNLQYRFSQQAA